MALAGDEQLHLYFGGMMILKFMSQYQHGKLEVKNQNTNILLQI
jgi:hypothetical protein